MTRPAHEEQVLARMEAELRHSDPRLVALFDRLALHGGRGARPPAAATWKRRLVAVLITIGGLAAALGGGQAAGWHAWRAGADLSRFDARAVAVVQAQLHDWRQEIRALVSGSPPQ